MYSYKIFRLFTIATIITYFSGCLWYFLSDNLNAADQDSFIRHFNLQDKTTD